jgi:hypothetical protein
LAFLFATVVTVWFSGSFILKDLSTFDYKPTGQSITNITYFWTPVKGESTRGEGNMRKANVNSVTARLKFDRIWANSLTNGSYYGILPVG